MEQEIILTTTGFKIVVKGVQDPTEWVESLLAADPSTVTALFQEATPKPKPPKPEPDPWLPPAPVEEREPTLKEKFCRHCGGPLSSRQTRFCGEECYTGWWRVEAKRRQEAKR